MQSRRTKTENVTSLTLQSKIVLWTSYISRQRLTGTTQQKLERPDDNHKEAKVMMIIGYKISRRSTFWMISVTIGKCLDTKDGYVPSSLYIHTYLFCWNQRALLVGRSDCCGFTKFAHFATCNHSWQSHNLNFIFLGEQRYGKCDYLLICIKI